MAINVSLLTELIDSMHLISSVHDLLILSKHNVLLVYATCTWAMPTSHQLNTYLQDQK